MPLARRPRLHSRVASRSSPTPDLILAEQRAAWIRSSGAIAWALAFSVFIPWLFTMASSPPFASALQTSDGRTRSFIDSGLSPGTTLGALAILATIIVALQVASRPSSSFVDTTQAVAVARVRVLEGIAAVSGMASVVVGVQCAWRVGLNHLISRPVETWGPIAAGVLLALVATDAATASQHRYGSSIATYRNRQTRDRLRQALKDFDTGTSAELSNERPSGYFLAAQIALALLACPVSCIAMLALAPGGGQVAEGLWIGGFGSLALIFTVVVLCQPYAALLRGNILPAIISALTPASLVLLLFASQTTMFLNTYDGSTSDVAFLIAAFSDTIILLCIQVTLVHWLLTRRSTARCRGLARHLLFVHMKRELTRLASPTFTTSNTVQFWRCFSLAALVLVPPAGVVVSVTILRSRSPRRAERMTAQIVLAVTSLIVAAALVGALFARRF
jgi:hypothetical protein